jgi:hypothetical protein
MKHLKRFNEDSDDVIEEVQSFCKMYLVDLIDNGGNVRVSLSDHNIFVVKLFLGVGKNMPIWGDVKDYFLPFLEMFNREYKLNSEVICYGRTSNLDYFNTVDELLSGGLISIDDKDLVRAISFNFDYDKVNESLKSYKKGKNFFN